MKQHASRYASATIPARAVLCDLPIDVFLGARPWRERRDHREQVGNGGVCGRNRPYRHLDLTVGLRHRLIEIDVPATKPPPNDHSTIHATKVAGSGGAGQRWVSFPSRAIRPYVCASYAFFNWSSDGGYTSNQSNPYTLSRDSFSVDQALADLRCTRATSNVDAEGFPREGLLKDALAQVAASHTPSRRRRASTWRPPART